MRRINTYLAEKLTLNKNTENELEFPVYIEFWSIVMDIYDMRDILNSTTDIQRFGLEDLQKDKGKHKLYKIELENKSDLLCFYSYLLGSWYEIFDRNLKDTIDHIKKYINNYDKVEEYLSVFSEDELIEAIKKLHNI